jgi:hypothetical protein
MSSVLPLLTTYPRPIAALLVVALLACAARGWRWPMALDAALLACYVARPSLQLLVLGGFFAALRWVPPFAAIVAQSLRVPEWGGLSLPVALFTLPGLQSYVAAPQPARAHTGATTRLQASGAPAPAQPCPARIPLAELFVYVNDRPDEVPHLAIIGPSGSGKTTMATAILASRPGQILVLTAKEGDTWGGLPYVGIDDDATYTTARDTFAALGQEVKGRLLLAKAKREPGEWLTVVLDDFSTLQAECPLAATIVKLIARLGRSLHVRLMLLSDSAQVRAIGLEGEGETRAHFAFVRLDRGHAATLDLDGELRPVDVRGLDVVAPDLSRRAWSTRPTPSAAAATETARAQRIALYRTWRAAKLTREQARAIRQAEGAGVDDTEWAEAGVFVP